MLTNENKNLFLLLNETFPETATSTPTLRLKIGPKFKATIPPTGIFLQF